MTLAVIVAPLPPLSERKVELKLMGNSGACRNPDYRSCRASGSMHNAGAPAPSNCFYFVP